jgi:hypothetical protein
MAKLKLFEVDQDNDDKKCGGCNWKVSNLYVLATSQEEAEQIYKKGDGGLCGDCMCELLAETSYEIDNEPKKQ